MDLRPVGGKRVGVRVPAACACCWDKANPNAVPEKAMFNGKRRCEGLENEADVEEDAGAEAGDEEAAEEDEDDKLCPLLKEAEEEEKR